MVNADELAEGASLVLVHEAPDLDALTATIDGVAATLVFGTEPSAARPDTATLEPAPSVGQVVEISHPSSDPVTLEVVAADTEAPAAPELTTSWRAWEPSGCGDDTEVGIMVVSSVTSSELGGTRHRVTVLADGEVAAESVVVHEYPGSTVSYDFLDPSYEGTEELCVQVQSEDPSGNVSETSETCIDGPWEGAVTQDEASEAGDDEAVQSCSVSTASPGPGLLALSLGLLLAGTLRRR